MDCPSLDTLAAWRAGSLARAQSDELTTHVEGCRRCSAAFSGLREAGLDEPPELPAGTQVGRFVVERRLGAGAMGVVYAARDPQLGRSIALKLLRGAATEPARARLLREAQAMARLSHPNVVVVHEAGELDRQVFVAMELVDGTSLDAWLAKRRPTWREAVEIFVQAGRGLAAAHAAGIIHRDFKPANVLVGADGRVRVGDFGLARDQGDASVDPAISPAIPDAHLTHTGAVLGTPAYMSPEQRRGERATAASDIYSFSVALHEGLYGVRPVDGIPVPPGSKVPPQVRRVVLRGLAARPEDRHPSMSALLEELLRTTRPRQLLPLAGALVAVAAAAVVVVGGASPRRAAAPPAPCTGIAERLGGVWDAARKAAIRDAFLATKLPFAAERWKRVEELTDRYAASWIEKSSAICAASEVRHELAAEERAVRQACLDQRLEKLRAWVGVMVEADERAVRNAVESASSRDGLAACDDPEPFVAPTPADPALAAQVRYLRNQLEALDVRWRVGQARAVNAGLAALRVASEAVPYQPLRAEILERTAMARMNSEDFEGAVPLLLELRRVAEEVRYDRLRATAWLHLARAYAWLYKPAEAHQAVRDAEAVIKPMGGKEVDRLRAMVAAAEADAFWDERKFPEAVAQATLALEITERLLGPADPGLAPRLIQQASLLQLSGKLDEAQAGFERAVRVLTAAGADETSIPLTNVMVNLGDVAAERGDWTLALDWFRKAQQRFELNRGPNHPLAARNLTLVARALVETGRPSEALPLLERARAVLEPKLPPDHPDLGMLYAISGKASLASGDLASARRWLDQSVKILAGAESADPVQVAMTRFDLAQALWGDRRSRRRARDLAVQAQGGLASAHPGDSARVAAWLAAHR